MFVPSLYQQRQSKTIKTSWQKAFERSVYLNEYKTKCQNKNMTKYYRYFLKSNFAGVN